MNYKLCSRLLSKYQDDDIRKLVYLYGQSIAKVGMQQWTIDDLNRQIKILEAENRFLKEEVNKQ